MRQENINISDICSDALPLNFSQSFLPERRLLAKLLAFVADGGCGDKITIKKKTGIPTGSSSGKVEPIIHYTRAMGLMAAVKHDGQWQLNLTPLGQVVFQEDAYLSESVTLWLMHLMLCRRSGTHTPATGVADAWFALFSESIFRLGRRFSQSDYLDFLTERHGRKSYFKSLSSILPRSYIMESCFGRITVLQEEKSRPENLFLRQSAPLDKSFYPVYAAYLYLSWDQCFPDETQISLEHFATETRCFVVLGWDERQQSAWLDWATDKGLLQLDRYTGTPIMLRLMQTDSVVGNIYDELL